MGLLCGDHDQYYGSKNNDMISVFSLDSTGMDRRNYEWLKIKGTYPSRYRVQRYTSSTSGITFMVAAQVPLFGYYYCCCGLQRGRECCYL